MEHSLRRAASTVCGRCAASLRGQLVARNAPRALPQAAAYHARYHSTTPSQTQNTGTSKTTPRNFTTSSKSESEAAAAIGGASQSQLKLSEDNLFHPFSSSPVQKFRERAAFMRQHAYCPHPDHQHTKMPTVAPKPDDASPTGGPEPPAHVNFECPDCGLATYCSKEHWMDDYENHLKICDTLRQINEDDHDLRSGRVFTEAVLPGDQLEESMINMTNWDTFMYTREFEAVNSDRGMRQITRLLTYPVTIGSVLHELSPYSLKEKERLTVEGLKSFSGKFAS